MISIWDWAVGKKKYSFTNKDNFFISDVCIIINYSIRLKIRVLYNNYFNVIILKEYVY